MAIEIVSCRISSNTLLGAMKKAGLSQEATAKRAGNMTSRQLSRIIHGEHCPSLERAVALSVVLGISVSALFVVTVKTRRLLERTVR